MKNILLAVSVLLLLSACKEEEMITSISLEEARAQQVIRFEQGEQSYTLRVFKDDSRPFGRIIPTEEISYDASSSFLYTRQIIASVPEEQVMEGHIETFGLEFNKIVPSGQIENEKFSSDEKFQSDFLSEGLQSRELSNFGFHRTYVIGQGTEENFEIEILKITPVSDSDDKIFVEGKFSGALNDWCPENENAIQNGEFKVIIKN